MLKVHRDRDSSASRVNNYPNGIEISIRGDSNSSAATGTKNSSLSLSVGTRILILGDLFHPFQDLAFLTTARMSI